MFLPFTRFSVESPLTSFCYAADCQITVRVPIGKNIIRDLSIPADIPREDFINRIYAQMGLNRERDELGWQTCDVGDRAAAQRLTSAYDVDQAFGTILDMMKSTRRRKPVFLKIKHLVGGKHITSRTSWLTQSLESRACRDIEQEERRHSQNRLCLQYRVRKG